MHKTVRVALIAVMVLFSLAAFSQTQITLKGSAAGTVTVTSTGTGNSVDILFTTLGGTAGNADWQYNSVVQSLGTFTITAAANPITATLNASGSWDINMNSQTLGFSFVGSDGNSLAGNIVLTTMSDGTNSAITFTGYVNITASSGSGLFTSLWPAGKQVFIDFTFANKVGGPWPSTIAGQPAGSGYTYGPGLANGGLSTGEVLPVPEPTTLALLGSGLVALGGMMRRYKK
ncbi:MAG: PEP-CTERM sorting domain-containing protein [Terriglobales bacterium]